MDDSLSLGGYMDQNLSKQKSQPLLKLEEIHRKTGETAQRNAAIYQMLLQKLKQKYPHMTQMELHMQVSGLMQQDEIRGFQFDNEFKKSQNQLQQTY